MDEKGIGNGIFDDGDDGDFDQRLDLDRPLRPQSTSTGGDDFGGLGETALPLLQGWCPALPDT